MITCLVEIGVKAIIRIRFKEADRAIYDPLMFGK